MDVRCKYCNNEVRGLESEDAGMLFVMTGVYMCDACYDVASIEERSLIDTALGLNREFISELDRHKSRRLFPIPSIYRKRSIMKTFALGVLALFQAFAALLFFSLALRLDDAILGISAAVCGMAVAGSAFNLLLLMGRD